MNAVENGCCELCGKKDDQKIQEAIVNLAVANKISPDASLLSDLERSNDTLCYSVP